MQSNISCYFLAGESSTNASSLANEENSSNGTTVVNNVNPNSDASNNSISNSDFLISNIIVEDDEPTTTIIDFLADSHRNDFLADSHQNDFLADSHQNDSLTDSHQNDSLTDSHQNDSPTDSHQNDSLTDSHQGKIFTPQPDALTDMKNFTGSHESESNMTAGDPIQVEYSGWNIVPSPIVSTAIPENHHFSVFETSGDHNENFETSTTTTTGDQNTPASWHDTKKPTKNDGLYSPTVTTRTEELAYHPPTITAKLGKDPTTTVDQNSTTTVDQDSTNTIPQDFTNTMGQDPTTRVGQDLATTVGQDLTTTVDQDFTTTLGHDFTVTYWFFFPYNRGKELCTTRVWFLGRIPRSRGDNGFCSHQKVVVGDHVGDWEHISIFFKVSMERFVCLCVNLQG